MLLITAFASPVAAADGSTFVAIHLEMTVSVRASFTMAAGAAEAGSFSPGLVRVSGDTQRAVLGVAVDSGETVTLSVDVRVLGDPAGRVDMTLEHQPAGADEAHVVVLNWF